MIKSNSRRHRNGCHVGFAVILPIQYDTQREFFLGFAGIKQKLKNLILRGGLLQKNIRSKFYFQYKNAIFGVRR